MTIRLGFVLCSILAMPLSVWADQAAVVVEPLHLSGPRPLEAQTEKAVIRDYLQSWQSLSSALEQNRADLLAQDFVGTARDKFTDTVQEQLHLGIHTRYEPQSHDIKVIFYSPEGLSIQLLDDVVYDEQVLDQQKILTTQRIHMRYVVVLTPSEVRWRVRVIQPEFE